MGGCLEFGCFLCTLICLFIAINSCVARDPLDIDSGVRSGIEDGLEVADNLEGEMLSRSWVGLCTSSYGSLVVDKYPNGIGIGVHLYPFSGNCCCL